MSAGVLMLTMLLPLWLLSGCGNVIRVDADYRLDYDFSRLRSYAWLDPFSPPSADIRIDNDLYRERVVAAVEQELETRGFVKVQDGCDLRCTYCAIWQARGPGRSRPESEVLAQIRGLAEAGHREFVLAGVHLGSYGRDRGEKLEVDVAAAADHRAHPAALAHRPLPG